MKYKDVGQEILAGKDIRGLCYFCKVEVGSEFYCFGCQRFVCYECDKTRIMGNHKISEHKETKDE